MDRTIEVVQKELVLEHAKLNKVEARMMAVCGDPQFHNQLRDLRLEQQQRAKVVKRLKAELLRLREPSIFSSQELADLEKRMVRREQH